MEKALKLVEDSIDVLSPIYGYLNEKGFKEKKDFMINMSALRKCTLVRNKVLENIIRKKEQRRKDLSELSFKEKIHILVQLQKMARGVPKRGKTAERIVWQI